MNRKFQLFASLSLFILSVYVLEFLVAHILYFEGVRSLFLLDYNYILDQLLSVGGLSKILSDFVAQFAHIKFLGSIIISFFIASSYFLLTTLKELSYSTKRWDYLSLIAFVPLYILSCSSSMEFSISYIVSIFFVSLLLALLNRYRLVSVAVIVTIIGYYTSGSVAIILPIVALFIFKQKIARYIPLLLFFIIVLLDTLINIEPLAVGYRAIFCRDVILFVLPVIGSMLLSRYLPQQKRTIQILLFSLSLIVMIIALSYRFVKRYSYEEKLMIKMEQSMNIADYDALLSWAERYVGSNLLKTYSINLALLATDRLPYEVLNYPQRFGLDALAMGSRGGQRKNDYAHHIYALLGMYNEAHRLVWESSTVNRLNRINLKQLVHYNHKIGREKIADKFDRLSSKTILNDDLVTLSSSKNIECDTSIARFINPYNICVDLIYLDTKATLTKQQSDCLMVGLLLSNRVLEFSKYTKYISLYYRDKPIPPLYDEALAMLKAALSSEEFELLGVEPTEKSQKLYNDYAQSNQKAKGNATALKSFSKSYFYYINFLSPYGSKVISQ